MRNLIFFTFLLLALGGCNSTPPEAKNIDLADTTSVRKETNRELKASITGFILQFVKSDVTNEIKDDYNILLQIGDLSHEIEDAKMNLEDYDNINSKYKSFIANLMFTNNYSSYIFLDKNHNILTNQNKNIKTIKIYIQYLHFNDAQNICDIAFGAFMSNEWGSVKLFKIKYDKDLQLEIISRYMVLVS